MVMEQRKYYTNAEKFTEMFTLSTIASSYFLLVNFPYSFTVSMAATKVSGAPRLEDS
jgi:hypothetical protein